MRGILWATEEPPQRIPRCVIPEVKLPKLEAHHLPPSGAEAEKGRTYTAELNMPLWFVRAQLFTFL
jgi:hypothetical protein